MRAIFFLPLLYILMFNIASGEEYRVPHKVERILYKKIISIGDGWATNTINTVFFRSHGIFTTSDFQFTSFYTQFKKILLIKRNIKTGKIETFELLGNYNLFDAHNSISMAIDTKGYLHISYDQHASDLAYRRSTKPLSIEHWTDELSMSGKREGNVTYPSFIMPRAVDRNNSNLLLLYRHGKSGRGDACLKRYNPDLQQWHDIEPCFLGGSQQQPWTSNPYWNHPSIDRQGRLHVSYVWRTHAIGDQRKINNINIDYAVSNDWGDTWETSQKQPIHLPITQVNSETILAVSPASNLINQTSSATDTQGNLHIVYYANDPAGIPQYKHLWSDGKEWNNKIVSNRTEIFNLAGGGTLQIPISRPEIVIDDVDRVYMIYRGDLTENKMAVTRLLPPDYSLSKSETRILWDTSVEYAEPIIDRLRWRQDKILSMLIQKNGQPPHDAKAKQRAEPVYIIDWDIVNDW